MEINLAKLRQKASREEEKGEMAFLLDYIRATSEREESK